MTSRASAPAERSGGEAAVLEDPAVLQISGARRSYGTVEALRGVDLTLAPAEIVALLGPNGAGKTTLLRAVSGRLALDAGHVRLAGRDPRTEPAVRRHLGLVPQSIALYPHLTARENLWVFARLMGVARRDLASTIDRALAWVGLAERAGEQACRLSGGMQRRLNIAAGTLHRPRVLLLDEPTVGVDPQAREAIHGLLATLRSDGMAILLTTHDMDEAALLAGRVAFLVEGRITVEGSPASLVRDTFGDDQELTVTLGAEPDDQGRGVLDALGLSATRVPRVWTGRIAEGFDAASRLAGRIGEAGIEVSEFRVREPDLHGVFLHLTGREFGH